MQKVVPTSEEAIFDLSLLGVKQKDIAESYSMPQPTASKFS